MPSPPLLWWEDTPTYPADYLAYSACFGSATITPFPINPELLIKSSAVGLILDDILVDCLMAHLHTMALKNATDLFRAVLSF